MTGKVSDAEFQRLYNEVARRGGKKDELRQKLGLRDSRPIDTRRARLEKKGFEFTRFGAPPRSAPPPRSAEGPGLDVLKLRDRVKALEAQLKGCQRDAVTESYVLEHVVGLVQQPPSPPKWLVERQTARSAPGVPTLFASDWHWGEVVDRDQVAGVNEFNLEIAQRRAKRLIEQTIYLLKENMVTPEYPGIVFALGGDMFSGDIHEELMATNEREIMPTFLDVHGVLIWCIETLANEFGRVFVPCVTGNHGRNTHKIRAKGRNFTNFDWLLYQLLAKHFAGDARVQFSIPDGPDCLYHVYNHRYLLTHGDQFRGGDGMIGALGPIMRGDHKKRSRNGQVGQGYDTMICGHWHQLIQLQRLIVNGSLKGYDEYANQCNFGFEPPRQALWITHPEHGITFSMPVLVDRGESVATAGWVSWREAV
ncbi:MAG: hypothetical protein ACREA0_15475 [bacterium]